MSGKKKDDREEITYIQRYALLAYNGCETIAEPFESVEQQEQRMKVLRMDGWSVSPSMGIFWETHTSDGKHYLGVENGNEIGVTVK